MLSQLHVSISAKEEIKERWEQHKRALEELNKAKVYYSLPKTCLLYLNAM